MAKRYLVTVSAEYFDSYGGVQELINWLEQYKDLERCSVDIPTNDWGEKLSISGFREETSDERKARLAKARKLKQQRLEKVQKEEEAEREQLKKLMKKYPEVTPDGL